MWFSNWEKIGQMLLIAAICYVVLVLLLRMTGKRSLAKMNMFDFIVTVAMGSMLANISLGGTPLIDGLLGITLLLSLQYIIAWVAVRNDNFDHFLKGDPTLLFYNGNYLDEVLKEQRVSRRELDEKIREKGFTSKNDVFAVVFETTGDLTVIGKSESKEEDSDFSALDMVSCGEINTEFC